MSQGKRAVKAWLAVLAASVMLVACGGSGEGLDQNGNPIGSPTPGPAPNPNPNPNPDPDPNVLTPTFSSIQRNVFTQVCAVACHSQAGRSGGMSLAQGFAYANIVDVNSSEIPSLKRIKPGDSANSYLIQKLRGSAGIAFDRMPLGGPFYTQQQIDIIAQWIDMGAPMN